MPNSLVRLSSDPAVEVVIALCVFALIIQLGRFLSRAAQPVRLELAEVGETMLAKPDLPDDVRHYVEVMLDEAFGSKLFYIFAFITSPFFALVLAVKQRWLENAYPKVSKLNPEYKIQLERIDELSSKLMTANNPFLHAILIIECALLMPIALALRAVIKGQLLNGLAQTTMLYLLSDRYRRSVNFLSHGNA